MTMQDQFSIPRNKKCEAVGSTSASRRDSRVIKMGQIEGRLNGEGIVHYKGPTVYQQQRGYPSHRYVYIKTCTETNCSSR